MNEGIVNITEMKRVKSKTNIKEKRVTSLKSWSTGEEVANSITYAIWHLFVLGGSISHFFGILFYLVSKTN